MELWIRTQDKKKLLKPNDIFFVNGCLYDRSDYDSTELGDYENNQRCMEIIDEIQSLMQNGNNHLITLKDDCDGETYEQLLDLISKNKLGMLRCTNEVQVHPLTEYIIYQMPSE